MNKKQLKEFFVTSNGFTKESGFAINTQKMNEDDFEEIFFSGKSLNEAIKDFYRKANWYAYQPSNGEQIFEDLDEAVEYIEDICDINFDDFIKAHKSLSTTKPKKASKHNSSSKKDCFRSSCPAWCDDECSCSEEYYNKCEQSSPS